MEISHAWQEYLPDIEIRKYTPKPSAVTVTTRILSAENTHFLMEVGVLFHYASLDTPSSP